jgi:putative addiction module killer protein
MHIIKTIPEFDAWLDGLKDRTTRLRLSRRLDKAQRGNLGDIKPVGDGVFEMREHFGPGWRMYYIQRGSVLIVMLGGGNKSNQSTDIAKAIELLSTLED